MDLRSQEQKNRDYSRELSYKCGHREGAFNGYLLALTDIYKAIFESTENMPDNIHFLKSEILRVAGTNHKESEAR